MRTFRLLVAKVVIVLLLLLLVVVVVVVVGGGESQIAIMGNVWLTKLVTSLPGSEKESGREKFPESSLRT